MHGHSEFPSPMRPDDVGPALAALANVEARQRLIGKWLDTDRPTALAFWKYVEAQQGLVVGKWHFVAHPECAANILRDEQRFSVGEYDRRMRVTSGRFFLGMDREEHEQDKKLGEIIPSWNTFQEPAHVDLAALERVRKLADGVTRRVLGSLARTTEIARLTDDRAECRMALVQLLGPVIDACAGEFFGVRGPSAFSLVLWARDITLYLFRAQGDDAIDRSPAQHASGAYRAHLLSLIGSLPTKSDPAETEPCGPLGQVVAKLREKLRACPHARVSDDDVARNLMGIMTGSISATAKAFSEALLLQPTAADQRIVWPELQSAPAACPYHPSQTQARVSFPHYDAAIAAPLARQQRGSLDAIYRRYEGPDGRTIQHHNHPLHKGDRVIVWIGGTLPVDPDNLYGIGTHKCPGMDMAKALLEGVLEVLMSLRGPDAPRRQLVDGEPILLFDNMRALERAAQPA